MQKLKIALLQVAPCDTLAENLEKGLRCCRQARAMGADIALFPEMWSNGYRLYDRPVEAWKAEAIDADGAFVNAFGRLAAQLQMAVGITLLERCGENPRNTLVLWDRFGRRRLVSAKAHTCDFDVERNLTPGGGFCVTTLDTACGEVKVGAMICYDREFPESARLLMLQGAELILTPNACPMEINRLAQLRGRAFENMLAIATCNYPETVPDCNGGSTVFDGVAYLPGQEGSRDTCLLQAGGEEGVYVAELDLEQLRAYRAQEVHGNAYRRPALYGALTDGRVEPPFVRPDARGCVPPEGWEICEVQDAREKSAVARTVLEALPEWFGLEAPREAYIAQSAGQLCWAAMADGRPAGFLCLKPTSERTAEVAVMGVLKPFQRRGAGRALLCAARREALRLGFAFLQVKTVQPGRCAAYDATNRFYRRMGFSELETFPTLWDEHNPCLIYVMALR